MELFWYFKPNPAYLRDTNHFIEVSRTICIPGLVDLRSLKISVKCNWAVFGMKVYRTDALVEMVGCLGWKLQSPLPTAACFFDHVALENRA